MKSMTFNAHSYGLSLDQFDPSSDKGLTAAFTPTATSIDSDGKVFVAAFESQTYPIFGIQFHPEKTIFSWYPNAHIPHDSTTMYYNRYFADFIVNEAKMNNQTLTGTFADQQTMIIENQKLKVVTSYDGLDYVFM
jgi:gamma-glutamyl hydrolase